MAGQAVRRGQSGRGCREEGLGPLAVLACLAGLLASPAALALDPAKSLAQYTHDSWTTRDGLPQTTVHTVAQTPDGYLWLATQVGLVRFDGVRFTVFDKSNSGLRHNHLWALLVARDGALWIGTEGGGITRLKDGQFTTFSTGEGLSSAIVRPIREGPDGTIWMGTEGGGVNALKDGKVTRLPQSDGLLRDVWALHVGGDGTVWVGTNGKGLVRVKDGVLTAFTKKDGLPDDSIWYLLEDRAGTLWVGTTGGVARMEGTRFRNYTTADGLAGDFVRTIYEDRQGTLWVGTTQGLSRLRNGRFESLRGSDGLTHDFVRTVYQDREGSIWIGTFAGGLDRLRDGPFTVLGRAEGLVDDLVRPIVETRDGSLWIGTNSAGLYRFKDGRLQAYTMKDGLVSDRVLALAEGRDDTLWIGGYAPGVNRLKEGRLTTYPPGHGLPNASLRALLEARDGTLWVGTMEGLARLRDGRFDRPLTTADGLPSNIVRTLLEGKDGRIWVGLTGGLACWQDGALRAWTAKDGLASSAVQALHEDAEGALWIGTNGGGLSRFAGGRFQTVNTSHGLADDVVHAIVDDGRGHLWLPSNRGISRVPKSDLDGLVRGTVPRIQSVSYDARDGMRSSEFMGSFHPAGWRARDGRLWFPTVRGAVSVDPREDRSNRIAPPVVIEEVLADGLPVPMGAQAAVVPAGTDRVAVRYTGLSLLVPSRVRFRYMLEGFDRDWIDPGPRREAFYTKIPPGRYRFRVTAANDAGVWNEAGAALAFRVEPRLHQTPWFRALAALLALALGWGLLQLRVRQLRGRESELSRHVEARTRELQQQVAERSRAEGELRAYKDTLQEEVARRTAELSQVNSQLQRDIAERVRAQQAEAALRAALEEAAVEWERTFDAMEMPVLILDSEGRLSRLNRAGRELLQGQGAMVLGRPVAHVAHGQPWQKASELAAQVRPARSNVHEQVRDPVSGRTWDLTAGPSRGPEGKERIIVVARDVTGMVDLQESLRRSETMSAMGMLVAGVAHEVRNPLFGISANLDALEVQGERGPKSLRMVALMKAEVERLRGLMQGLLDYGRPARSSLAAGSIVALVEEALERCHGLGSTARVGLVNEVPGGLPLVLADRDRLLQVLQNLLQNAIQHSRPGGVVTVQAETEEADGGSWVVVRVGDTGPGFLPEDLPHVFEPFFSRRRGGTGLGLAIAHRIILEHGGRIGASNRPEGGGMVTIRLRCAGRVLEGRAPEAIRS